MNALQKLIAENYKNTFSYKSYREKIDALHAEGKVTGPVQDEHLLEYSKLNVHRMDRWDKHTKLSEETISFFSSVTEPLNLLIISEGWCGDAAQIVPVVIKMIGHSNSIQAHIILRDEHLEIMDMFLTNGKSRSIPIFVIIDNHGQVLGKYGPRPEKSQALIDELKSSGADNDQIKEKLHLWYARDKHAEIEKEFVQAMKSALERSNVIQ